MAPTTSIVGASSSRRLRDSDRNSVARYSPEVPGELLQLSFETIQENKASPLKPNFSDSADVAEAVAIRLCIVAGQSYFNSNAGRVNAQNLRGKQPIIRTRRGAANLSNLAMLPVLASN